MRVYHSSTCIVDYPDTKHSRDYLDFGRGFYLTTMEDQARSYALRFTARGKKAFLNTYEFGCSRLADLKVVEFDSYNEPWLDFVMGCRSGNDYSDWDVVVGGVANDRVFTTVDLYFAGEITKDEALGRLAYAKPNNQICLRSQKAINTLLTFVSAEELS